MAILIAACMVSRSATATDAAPIGILAKPRRPLEPKTRLARSADDLDGTVRRLTGLAARMGWRGRSGHER